MYTPLYLRMLRHAEVSSPTSVSQNVDAGTNRHVRAPPCGCVCGWLGSSRSSRATPCATTIYTTKRGPRHHAIPRPVPHMGPTATSGPQHLRALAYLRKNPPRPTCAPRDLCPTASPPCYLLAPAFAASRACCHSSNPSSIPFFSIVARNFSSISARSKILLPTLAAARVAFVSGLTSRATPSA